MFGAKKEGNDDSQGTPNAPIKAKLGEQSSFYYDKEQKRWVNKKDPDSAPAAKAAPPPPKGPASRSVSAADVRPPSSVSTPPVPPLPPMIHGTAASNPPSLHPSRSPSPAIVNEPVMDSATTRSVSASGPPSGPPSAPPSRPATGMSGASNIDDLIGAPQARKGGTVRKGKKGRGYVDVMAK